MLMATAILGCCGCCRCLRSMCLAALNEYACRDLISAIRRCFDRFSDKSPWSKQTKVSHECVGLFTGQRSHLLLAVAVLIVSSCHMVTCCALLGVCVACL